MDFCVNQFINLVLQISRTTIIEYPYNCISQCMLHALPSNPGLMTSGFVKATNANISGGDKWSQNGVATANQCRGAFRKIKTNRLKKQEVSMFSLCSCIWVCLSMFAKKTQKLELRLTKWGEGNVRGYPDQWLCHHWKFTVSSYFLQFASHKKTL